MNSDYASDCKAYLLEQYKICVEMADRVSARRIQTNSFYLSLLSALLVLLSLSLEKKLFSEDQGISIFLTSILSLFLCLSWYINIESYRQLNTAKFEVINEIEKSLPFLCFSREWEKLLKIRKRKQYMSLTSVEKFIPILFSIPYFGLFLYSIFL